MPTKQPTYSPYVPASPTQMPNQSTKSSAVDLTPVAEAALKTTTIRRENALNKEYDLAKRDIDAFVSQAHIDHEGDPAQFKEVTETFIQSRTKQLPPKNPKTGSLQTQFLSAVNTGVRQHTRIMDSRTNRESADEAKTALINAQKYATQALVETDHEDENVARNAQLIVSANIAEFDETLTRVDTTGELLIPESEALKFRETFMSKLYSDSAESKINNIETAEEALSIAESIREGDFSTGFINEEGEWEDVGIKSAIPGELEREYLERMALRRARDLKALTAEDEASVRNATDLRLYELEQSIGSGVFRDESLYFIAQRHARILDGDTIWSTDARTGITSSHRFFGIQAPESNTAAGVASAEYLDSILAQGLLYSRPTGKTSYNRAISEFYVMTPDGRKLDVGYEMIKAGQARYFAKFSSNPKLAEAQRQAKANGIGIFGQPGDINSDKEASERAERAGEPRMSPFESSSLHAHPMSANDQSTSFKKPSDKLLPPYGFTQEDFRHHSNPGLSFIKAHKKIEGLLRNEDIKVLVKYATPEELVSIKKNSLSQFEGDTRVEVEASFASAESNKAAEIAALGVEAAYDSNPHLDELRRLAMLEEDEDIRDAMLTQAALGAYKWLEAHGEGIVVKAPEYQVRGIMDLFDSDNPERPFQHGSSLAGRFTTLRAQNGGDSEIGNEVVYDAARKAGHPEIAVFPTDGGGNYNPNLFKRFHPKSKTAVANFLADYDVVGGEGSLNKMYTRKTEEVMSEFLSSLAPTDLSFIDKDDYRMAVLEEAKFIGASRTATHPSEIKAAVRDAYASIIEAQDTVLSRELSIPNDVFSSQTQTTRALLTSMAPGLSQNILNDPAISSILTGIDSRFTLVRGDAEETMAILSLTKPVARYWEEDGEPRIAIFESATSASPVRIDIVGSDGTTTPMPLMLDIDELEGRYRVDPVSPTAGSPATSSTGSFGLFSHRDKSFRDSSSNRVSIYKEGAPPLRIISRFNRPVSDEDKAKMSSHLHSLDAQTEVGLGN